MPKNLNLDVPISLPAGMPSVSLIKNVLHILQVLGTVLTICVVAPIIAAENRFYGASQPGPNYTLFVGLSSVVIPVCMVVFPWLYDTKGKFRHFGKFFLKPRTSLIFTGFYTGFWCTAGIAMTVHANNPAHCNLDSDLQESYGDDYTGTWASQCTCGKAGAGLAWTTCILWLLSLLCTLIIFFNEKQMIQKNLKQHEMNKQAVLQMQQQQEEEDEWGDVERRGGYRPTSYYEQDEGEDLGGMRPQSFEQARPLHSPPQVHHHQTGSLPFESPYDPPVTHYDPTAQYDPHNHGYPEQHGQYSVQPDPAAQYDPHNHGYPEQHGQYAVQPEQSPFDDIHRQPSPEPPYQAAPTPPQHQQQFSPMPMPDPSHYSTQPHVDRF